MNVLSLFDGISCARVALDRAGVVYDSYYASEIDKWAIKIAQHNYPSTIQVGNVCDLKASDLPKIDLLIGGSPCQGFSRAGHGLNFDDPRSRLFFEYVRLLSELQPDHFLLENVKMKKEWRDVITGTLGVDPILINSSLVSAQNRERYYWTNIPGVAQPDDKGIMIRDILEDVSPVPAGWSGAVIGRGRDCLDFVPPEITGAGIRNQYLKNSKITELHLNVRPDGKSNAVTPNYRRLNGLVRVGTIPHIGGHEYNRRVYSSSGKSPTLAGSGGGHQEPKIALNDLYWRKLTPLECERLQTLPDNYTAIVSNSQRFRAVGNGFTVDVIAHILKYMGMPEKSLIRKERT